MIKSLFKKKTSYPTVEADTNLDPKAKKPKIVLAPLNLATMPIHIVKALRANGYTAEHVQYTMGEQHRFGYEMDREINLKDYGGRIDCHTETIRHYLEKDYDIFHFWNRSFFYKVDYFNLSGFDVPLIKARRKKIIYRFSGFDIRLPSLDKKYNKYSPFKYGYDHLFDENIQAKYLDFLREYVDLFLVQDPELLQFCPEAKIIPRALDLKEFEFVGVEKKEVPLVIHAPSNEAYKGTKYVLKAVEELQEEGVKFDFKLVTNMKHDEAKDWYRKSDIIIDQLLIGATGVLTLEAMALGKPCINYLREDLFKPYYGNDLPVANANPDNIKKVLKNLIKDQDQREHLSKLGRKVVEEKHDINDVIGQFTSTYNKVHLAEPSLPTGTRDLDYLAIHAKKWNGNLSMLNKLRRNSK